MAKTQTPKPTCNCDICKLTCDAAKVDALAKKFRECDGACPDAALQAAVALVTAGCCCCSC